MHRLTCTAPYTRQRGITLIESLVALVITILGILGIIGMQMRTLATTQTSMQRSVAIQFIEDLSERLKVNPNAEANAADYEIGWGTASDNSLAPLAPLTPRAARLCDTAACTAQEQAQFDVREWKRSIELAMGPGMADAMVFPVADESATTTNRRQLGVMISWRQNEESTAVGTGAYYTPFDITASQTGVAAATCPADRICHLQYIQLASRCKVDDRGGAANLLTFCPQ